MKAYGLSTKEYENDSKKAGDLFSKNKARSGAGVRSYLRSLKKKGRRLGKIEITVVIKEDM